MHIFGTCFGFCFGERPGTVHQLDAPVIALPPQISDCSAKLKEGEARQDGTPAESRPTQAEDGRVEDKTTSTVVDTPSSVSPLQQVSFSMRPETRPELASLLVSANSFSKAFFQCPTLQLSNYESTASMGSGTIALISDVRVNLAGERRVSDCGPIAVKLSTLEQLLASVTEPLWVGQGAQGAVLKAQWRSAGCTVAVKWLVSNGGDLPAACMEALLAKMLAHPFLVQTFEYGMCQLDESFDQLQQEYQQLKLQQQLCKRQSEGGQRRAAQQQEQQQQQPEAMAQLANQPLYPCPLISLGQCHAPQEQQQQQALKEPAESGIGCTSGRPIPHSQPHAAPLPTQHRTPGSISGGAAGLTGCCGLSDESSCCGVNTRELGHDVCCLAREPHVTSPAPAVQPDVGTSPQGPSTPNPWDRSLPSAYETAGATSPDSFDGSGTLVDSRSVDCVAVLKQLGATPGKYVVQIVSEWCDEGTLHSAIRRGVFKPHPPRPGGSGRSRTWALRALLRTAREVAMGMCHLHSLNIIHGDLKPGNVLLKSSRIDSRGFVAKVADFGLSRLCNRREEFVATAEWGTVPYMAGEYLDNRLCKSSDVYSFGVLLWQMYTGRTPFAGHLEAQVAVGVMMGNLRLEWPQNMPPPLLRLGQACCRHEPEQRPTFKEVAVALMGIETQVRDAHTRAKLAVRRVEGGSSATASLAINRPMGGSCGDGGCSSFSSALLLAHAMSQPQPHGSGAGVGTQTAASAGAGLPITALLHPLYPYQSRPQPHPHQLWTTNGQLQRHSISVPQLRQQRQRQQPYNLQGMNAGACNPGSHLLASRLLEPCRSLSHTQLLGNQKVGMLRGACSAELTSERPDLNPSAPPSSFVSTAGADVMGAVSMVAAGMPASPLGMTSPPPHQLGQPQLPPLPPLLQSPQQQPPSTVTQTQPLQPPVFSGRFMPMSTSRLHIRTSFADVAQQDPVGVDGGYSNGDGGGNGGLYVSSVVQDADSPPTLLDSLSMHQVVMPPPSPLPPLPLQALQAAATGVTVLSMTHSSATESPPGALVPSPLAPAAAVAWAACATPIIARNAEAGGRERTSPVITAALAMAAGPSPMTTVVVPSALARDAEAGRQQAFLSALDVPVISVNRTATAEMVSVFAEVPCVSSTGPSAGADNCTVIAPKAEPVQASTAASTVSCLALQPNKTSQEHPPRPQPHHHHLQAHPPRPAVAAMLFRQPLSNPYGLGAASDCASNLNTESSECHTRAATPGLSAVAAEVTLSLPEIQRHASLPVSLPDADGNDCTSRRGTCHSAFETLPEIEEPNPAPVNKTEQQEQLYHQHQQLLPQQQLHQKLQQQMQQETGSVDSPVRGGRVALTTSQPGLSVGALGAAAALHRRPRSAFGLGSATAAAAGRRGSGAGPMPHLYGSSNIAGFTAGRPSLEELTPHSGFASMMLISLAPLHESVEGPGGGNEL